jgi:hypothetical protein
MHDLFYLNEKRNFIFYKMKNQFYRKKVVSKKIGLRCLWGLLGVVDKVEEHIIPANQEIQMPFRIKIDPKIEQDQYFSKNNIIDIGFKI